MTLSADLDNLLCSVLFEQEYPITVKNVVARLNLSFTKVNSGLLQFAQNNSHKLFTVFINSIVTDNGITVFPSHTPLTSIEDSPVLSSKLYALVPRNSSSAELPSLDAISASDYQNVPKRSNTIKSTPQPMEAAPAVQIEPPQSQQSQITKQDTATASQSTPIMTQAKLNFTAKPKPVNIEVESKKEVTVVQHVASKPKTNMAAKIKQMLDEGSDFECDDDDLPRSQSRHQSQKDKEPPLKHGRVEEPVVIDIDDKPEKVAPPPKKLPTPAPKKKTKTAANQPKLTDMFSRVKKK
ncbi:hypothetical protein RCL1_006223 [Eukaryota sp. TZLM3-RCL]